MSEQKIICPNCGFQIPLTEAFSLQMREKIRGEFALQSQKKEAEIAEKMKVLDLEKKNIEEEKESLSKTLEKRMKVEREKILEMARKEAEESLNLELKYLQTQNEEQKKKIEESRKGELDSRKEIEELKEQNKMRDLEFQRKFDAEKEKIVEKTKIEMMGEGQMKIKEKDKQLEMLRKTIEDLKRRSEQGSMQIQGEVQEEDLREILRANFPADTVNDVPTGIRGGDIIQMVNSKFGEKCGVILWESKNTKSWSNDWIRKLKDDQIMLKSDICILVSKTLPEGIKNFSFSEGVWICDYRFSLSLVYALRLHLYEMNNLKKSFAGKGEKMEVLYNYLSGSQFKNRIENIVMTFVNMKTDLDAEKRAFQKIWSRREKEIERVIENTSGMYGELQGIIGSSVLPQVKSLELEDSAEERLL